MYDVHLQSVNLKNEKEKAEVRAFLNKLNLDYSEDVDYTVVLKNNGSIKATCSKAGTVFKCFGIIDELRGEGITAALISNLTDKLFEEGKYHSFIFTKPEKQRVFTCLNYKVIHQVEEAVLLEKGIYDISSSLKEISERYNINIKSEKAAIVMNCNPFTLGHLFLIEKAAAENSEVLVFILEEDRSQFSFNDRYALVKSGTKHLENVKVIPAGEYIISSVTFPTYFIKSEDERLKAYTEMDAGIFGRYFCNYFNITRRYVGEEPLCKVTSKYNEILEKILKKYAVEVCKIPRKCYDNNCVISASEVRGLMEQGDMDKVRKMVPQVTWDFLKVKRGY